MDINFKVKRLEYLRPVCIRSVSSEDTFEYILPDTMPDAGAVLSVQATALLRSKDPRAGSCAVGASAELSLTYSPPDGSGIFAVEGSFPFGASAEDGQITPNALAAASVQIVSAEARIISSRKLLIKVNSAFMIECYEQDEYIIPIDTEEEGYELSKSNVLLSLTDRVDEKTFEISENFPLEGAPAAQILTWRARIESVETSLSGDRLTVKGKLKLCVTYRPQGSAVPVYTEHETDFIQAANLMTEGAVSQYRVNVELTSAYVTCEPGLSGDGRSIGFDMGAVLQFIVNQELELPCLCDMYSTKKKVSCTYSDLTFPCAKSEAAGNVSAQVSVKTDSVISRYLSAECAAGAVTASRETPGVYNAELCAAVLWQDGEGGIVSKPVRLSAASLPIEGSPVCVTARAGDGIISPNSSGCDMKIPVSFTAYYLDRQKLSCVSQASGEAAPSDAAVQVWVRRFGENDSLWEIGKRHGVSVDSIRKASQLDKDALPQSGSLLIIPKM